VVENKLKGNNKAYADVLNRYGALKISTNIDIYGNIAAIRLNAGRK